MEGPVLGTEKAVEAGTRNQVSYSRFALFFFFQIREVQIRLFWIFLRVEETLEVEG